MAGPSQVLLSPDSSEAARHLDTKSDTAPPSNGRERRRIKVQEVSVFHTLWKQPAEIYIESKLFPVNSVGTFPFYAVNENIVKTVGHCFSAGAMGGGVLVWGTLFSLPCSHRPLASPQIGQAEMVQPCQPWGKPFQADLSFLLLCFVSVT